MKEQLKCEKTSINPRKGVAVVRRAAHYPPETLSICAPPPPAPPLNLFPRTVDAIFGDSRGGRRWRYSALHALLFALKLRLYFALLF